jgi:hypothetical protein
VVDDAVVLLVPLELAGAGAGAEVLVLALSEVVVADEDGTLVSEVMVAVSRVVLCVTVTATTSAVPKAPFQPATSSVLCPGRYTVVSVSVLKAW